MIKVTLDSGDLEYFRRVHSEFVIEKSKEKIDFTIKEYELKCELLKIYSKKVYLSKVKKIFQDLPKAIQDSTLDPINYHIEKSVTDFIKKFKEEIKLSKEGEKKFEMELEHSLSEIKNAKSEYELFLYLKREGMAKLANLDKEEIANFPESFSYDKELRKLSYTSLKLKYIKTLKFYKNSTYKSLECKDIDEFLSNFKCAILHYKFQYLKQNKISSTYIKTKNDFDKMVGKWIKRLEEEISPVLKKLEDIFDYDEFVQSYNSWGAYEFVDKLKVGVCPYCNRAFTSTYRSQHGRTRPELDHFYIKSIYPYLALTLYNLVPSCHVCNSNLKGDKDFVEYKPIYPYSEEFGQAAKFKTGFYTDQDHSMIENDKDIKEIQRYDVSYLLGNSYNFKIELEIQNPKMEKGKKIQNSKDTFKLEQLYSFNKDYVKELIKKATIYNESRIDELYTQYRELFDSREEVLQTIVSNYIEDDNLGKRPLAKLTKDICEELGLK